MIHNFNEAHQQYQYGLIPYRLVQDQAAVMLGISRNPYPTVVNASDITDTEINWLLQQAEASVNFADFL